MKDVEEQFEALIAWARNETPPRVDVADRVLAILSAKQDRSVGRPKRVQLLFASERPWMYLAAVSSAAAIPAGLLTFFLYQAWSDPLAELVEAVSWVIQ
jgi:hypothetical protein